MVYWMDDSSKYPEETSELHAVAFRQDCNKAEEHSTSHLSNTFSAAQCFCSVLLVRQRQRVGSSKIIAFDVRSALHNYGQ